MDIITRKQALELGLKRYFTGEPCKNGHVDERFVSNFRCYTCLRELSKTPEYQQRANARMKQVRATPEGKAARAVSRRKHYEANREQCIEIAMATYRRRIAEDPSFRLKERLRTRVKLALTGKRRSAPYEKLLGASVEYVRSHLESQWQEGMSWENYSLEGWHVDHIRPVASFDLADPDQQRECFHYSNLQPLWANENRAKSDSWAGTSR